MIAAFAIMAAVAANAAATSWSITCKNIVGTDGSGKYTSGENVVIFAALTGTGSWVELKDVDGVSINAGVINALSGGSFSTELLDETATYDFKFTITDGDKTWTSTVLSEKPAQKSASVSLAFGNQSSQTWQSVPEPTSGLLLLLGMASLALKRKRA